MMVTFASSYAQARAVSLPPRAIARAENHEDTDRSCCRGVCCRRMHARRIGTTAAADNNGGTDEHVKVAGIR
jgi:hypothetical protein